MIIQYPQANELYQPEDLARMNPEQAIYEGQGDAFEIDLSRIVHSGAFRRLQAKTQVIGLHVSDVQRTRLTHSMEVAQIARQMVIHLNQHPLLQEKGALDASLIEAAALAHDLGHAPFGHRGEAALNQCMRDFGGFEANAQTFRLLTRLEGESGQGLNLTRGLLLSIMKYPRLFHEVENRKQYEHDSHFQPPKASVFTGDQGYFEWVLDPFSTAEKNYLQACQHHEKRHHQTIHKTLEASLIEIADDLAYGTHDVEDGINLGMIRLHDLKQILNSFAEHTSSSLQQARALLQPLQAESSQLKYRIKHVFSLLITAFVSSLQVKQTDGLFVSPRLQYQITLPEHMQQLLRQLHQLVADEVIGSQRVQTISYRGSYMIQHLFAALMTESSLLPRSDRQRLRLATTEAERARIVCDYIAGMTDSFAMKMHARLFGQSHSFFDT
jgi:dGTPase